VSANDISFVLALFFNKTVDKFIKIWYNINMNYPSPKGNGFSG